MERKEFNLIDFIMKCDPKTKDRDLRMHKILYFTYSFYYVITKGKELFEPKFVALSYGPVEQDYREYYLNKERKIIVDINNQNFEKKFLMVDEMLNLKSEIGDYEWEIEKKDLIKFIIVSFLKNKKTWSLVDFSHNTIPWIESAPTKSKIDKKILNNFSSEFLMFTYDRFFEGK